MEFLIASLMMIVPLVLAAIGIYVLNKIITIVYRNDTRNLLPRLIFILQYIALVIIGVLAVMVWNVLGFIVGGVSLIIPGIVVYSVFKHLNDIKKTSNSAANSNSSDTFLLYPILILVYSAVFCILAMSNFYAVIGFMRSLPEYYIQYLV